MKQEEAILQAECFKYAWNHYPQTRGMIFHVPNGGYRNKAEAVKFKAIGLVAGVPDIIFLWKGKTYFFEFKALNGTLSDSQVEWQRKAYENGFHTTIINDFQVWKKEIENIVNFL